jgi:O-antigen biosynthesis protein
MRPGFYQRVRKMSAGCLSGALLALLPYYRRYLPMSWRRVLFAYLPAGLKRLTFEVRSQPIMSYENWILQNDILGDDDRRLISAHIASFWSKPRFSILMPVCSASTRPLQEAIDSIRGQLYEKWELCVVGDAASSPGVRKALHRYAESDDRIRVRYCDVNGGVSASSNTALEMATGEWLVLMEQDDTLAEHALYLVAEAINRDPKLAIIYSDLDHIDEEGVRSNPYFKPDWDYDLFLGQNLINRLGAYRTALTRRVGGFREGLEGSQDWDFAFRVIDANPGAKVHHIPFVLYHWRQTSGTLPNTLVTAAADTAQRAVNDHLTRSGEAAVAIPQSSYLRIRRILPTQSPLVSIVIPTKDRCDLLRTCVAGLVNRTNYKPVEIVIVDNASSAPDALEFLAELRVRPNFVIVEDGASFNFSRLINRGVAASSGEICVLLNNDIDVINDDWLDELTSHALRPEVGAVGAKLYFADGTLQHGGVILGIAGGAGHQHRHCAGESHGYFGRLKLTRSVSCVTGACLATRRAVYDEVGGFEEQHLTVAYNDVDFCIRLGEAGYKIIWTPHAELYHYECTSRGLDTTPEKMRRAAAEMKYMRTKWNRILDNDPFHNPNLSLDSESVELAERPRVHKPWLVSAWAADRASASPTAVNSRLNLPHARRRLQPLDRRPGVRFVGYADGDLGLGEAFRAYLAAAAQAGLAFAIYPFRGGIETRLIEPFMPERYDTAHAFDINVVLIATDLTPVLLRTVDPQLMSQSYNILCTFWELPQAPEAWRPLLEGFRELWVPNAFVADAFRDIFAGTITIIPPAIHTGDAPVMDRAVWRMEPGRFYFLFSFDYFSSPHRKNPMAVVRAFREAFADRTDNVGLILKCFGAADRFAEIRSALLEAAKLDPRIIIIEKGLKRDEMLGLIRASDAYISLHRSEGFGMGMAEAMSFGRIVIGTNFSGNVDFLTSDTGFPVPYTLRRVEPSEYIWGSGQVWAEPDVEAAAKVMRLVIERPDLAAERTRAAKALIEAEYGLPAIGLKIKRRITEIEAHASGARPRRSHEWSGTVERGSFVRQRGTVGDVVNSGDSGKTAT